MSHYVPCLFLRFSTTAWLEMLTKRRQTPCTAPPRSTVETQQDTGTVCFADVSHFQPANVYFFGRCWPKSSDLPSFLLFFFFFWSEPLHAVVAPTKFLYLFNMQWHSVSSWIQSAGYLLTVMTEIPVFVWKWSKCDPNQDKAHHLDAKVNVKAVSVCLFLHKKSHLLLSRSVTYFLNRTTEDSFHSFE